MPYKQNDSPDGFYPAPDSNDSDWRDGRTQVYRRQADSDPVDDFLRDFHIPSEDTPEPPPERSAPVRAYNRDYADMRPNTRHAADSQAPRTRQPSRASRQEPAPAKPKRQKRRRRWPKILLLILLILALLMAGLWFWFPSRPDATANKEGDVATVLIAGTDEDGTRTDTMMLLYVNQDTKAVNLLSLPRDSYVEVDGEGMKLNAVYGYGGCGTRGMELLMEELEDVIGYTPDGYVLFSFDSVAKVVDAMGGVEFDVPMDMFYEDSSQDLYIDLKEGVQTLDGQEAVQVLRFRSGYALADLERINVQRDLAAAAMEQWVRPSKLPSGLRALSILTDDATTNLSARNLFWFAKAIVRSDLSKVESHTLPGEWDNPYYQLYYRDRAALINEYFNPTDRQFDGEDFE